MNIITAFLTDVPEGRLFALDTQTLISIGIQLLNFIILAVILGRLLYKPVQKFINSRAERISGQLNDAQQRMSKAETLKAEYETKLKDIEAERAAVLEEARLEAAERTRKILEEARLEADSIAKRAEENIQFEKERFKKEAWRHIVEVSSLMTEKVIRKTIDSETQNKLFDEAMSELEGMTWQ